MAGEGFAGLVQESLNLVAKQCITDHNKGNLGHKFLQVIRDYDIF